MAERIWLDVSFAQKDAAKAAGARWDPVARRWFAPVPGIAGLRAWTPLPVLLPGEDRSFGGGLFVDLVPRSCWFTNVRSCVQPEDWDRLRRMVYGRAGQRCEACGAGRDPARGLVLEAHERWSFDEATGVQRLRRLVCLCSACHSATHFGLARLQGRDDVAMRHLAAVNGWTPGEVAAHVDAAMAAWLARSGREWALDLQMLDAADVQLRPAPSPADRRRASIPSTPPPAPRVGQQL